MNNDRLAATGTPPASDDIVDDERIEGATSSRFDAPIRYADLRRSFNTMRAFGAAVVAAAAAYGVTQGYSASPWVLAASLLITADALYRRNHGRRAFPLLFVDITLVGASLLVYGPIPATQAAGVAYVVTVSLLLLGLRQAILTMLYAALWAVPLIVKAPLVNGSTASGTEEFGVAALGVATFLVIIVQLLISARHALFSAGQLQREALVAERRAGRLKNEFVSMVSHELRTPLTSIAGFADTLRESWKMLDEAEIEEFLTIVRRETGHLRDLVEDILVIPRLEAGHLRLEPTDLDLRDEAFSTAQLVFQGSDTEFSVAVPGGVIVSADPVRLKQVLRNLLENARKYGGDQVLVEGEPDGPFYLVSVSDNGPGVPPEDRERIFDHFEQLTKGDARSDQGVGLGLPIARTLVRAMGGDLWYEDRFPTGSRFRFTIALSRPAPVVEPATEADSQVA